jgi:hypothetical protein
VIKLDEIQPNYTLRDAIELFLKKRGQDTPTHEEKDEKVEKKENKEPTHWIREIAFSDAAECSRMMTDVFYHDPWIDFFLPSDDGKKEALQWFFNVVLGSDKFLFSFFCFQLD